MFFIFALALASTLLFTLFFGSSYGFSAVVAPQDLILHAYEHCHFTTRTRLVLGWAGVPFNLKWYGYGDGADPGKCEGFGYNPVDGGTIPLMGKKMCPVLTGTQVPTLEGKLGMGESMEICSYGISIGNKVTATTFHVLECHDAQYILYHICQLEVKKLVFFFSSGGDRSSQNEYE